MDICGQLPVTSLCGKRYFLSIIDDFSNYSEVYCLEKKSEAVRRFIEFKNKLENLLKAKILAVKTDNGGEFNSNLFREYLKENGIQKRTSSPYAHQQNGKIERLNRTLLKKARALLFHNNVDVTLWDHAVMTANVLRNNTYSKAIEGIPSAVVGVSRVDATKFRVWGCRAFVRVPKEKRDKLEKHSEEMLFVGYAADEGGYRFYSPSKNKFVVSRDALFAENETLLYSENQKESVENFFVKFHPNSENSIAKEPLNAQSESDVSNDELISDDDAMAEATYRKPDVGITRTVYRQFEGIIAGEELPPRVRIAA